MKEVGRKIYYNVFNGQPIVVVPEMQGDFVPTTMEQDIATYTDLYNRQRDSFDVLNLPYGAYAQDFIECLWFQVNTVTKELEFVYPLPGESEDSPVYRKPLSEELDGLKQENTLLKAQNQALTERADFIEDVVAEMAIQVY